MRGLRDTGHRTDHPNNGRDGHRRHRWSVGSLLAMVVLIPVVGMVVIGGNAAITHWELRDDAILARDSAAELSDLTQLRMLAAEEQVPAATLAVAATLGADATLLEDRFGIDFPAELEAARRALDDEVARQDDPELTSRLAALANLRQQFDATLDLDALRDFHDEFAASIDTRWADRIAALRSAGGELGERLDAVDATHVALVAGFDRTRMAVDVITGTGDTEATRDLIDADARLRTATAGFPRGFGPAAASEWRQITGDPGIDRYEETMALAVDVALYGGSPLLFQDPDEVGAAMFDGVTHASSLGRLAGAAADDLEAAGNAHQAEATRALVATVAVTLVLGGAALGATVVLARSMVRPLAAMSDAATSVYHGSLHPRPVPVQGPVEIATTVRAFNDMTVTLAAVEERTVALAENPESLVDADPLPGRTGQALQHAIDRLQRSMRESEENRRRLEQEATHDAMTGLLNRAAALEQLGVLLQQGVRSSHPLAVLYVDLDDLKPINDTWGHAAGDQAIIATGAALRDVTRPGDLVARLGGDEFLVAAALAVDSTDAEATAWSLAERVHAAVSACVLDVHDTTLTIRCSVGLAVVEPDRSTVFTAIRAADEALYGAKQAGGARVAIAPPSLAG